MKDVSGALHEVVEQEILGVYTLKTRITKPFPFFFSVQIRERRYKQNNAYKGK